MSASLNKVMIMGKICQKGINPFNTKSGTSGVFLNVGTWKKVKEEYKHTFHKIVFYAAIADTIVKYAKPGVEVYIEGEIESNDTEFKIVGHEFQFVSPKLTV